MTLRSGGQILIDQLHIHGTRFIFGVPGESYLPALDALVDVPAIRFITCRQEGGAAMMAEAYGKLTHKAGICFVTRGPGACNAAAGVHIAAQDSTPMILLIGQVEQSSKDREAFQEVDYGQMFGGMAKWVAEVPSAERLPEYISRAFAMAEQGRMGVVILALPEEVLCDRADCLDARPYKRAASAPLAADMDALAGLLSTAKKPILLLGGSGWTAQASADIIQFAEHFSLPVICSFRRQGAFDNAHPHYCGDLGLGANPKLITMIKQSDLLIAVGARLGENPSQGYSLLAIPAPQIPLVHVHSGAEELGKVYQADLPILASNAAFADAAKKLVRSIETQQNTTWREQCRAAYETWQQPVPSPTIINMSEIAISLKSLMPQDTIYTNGAGNYATWLHRFHRYSLSTQLAPTSGSMGYGVPAAIAAKLVSSDKTVMAWAGDGCFLMHGQELATAVQYGLGIIFVIINNGSYGTIRMHQERRYPQRVSATDLHNPDFIALAQAYGAAAWQVKNTADFAPAVQAALTHCNQQKLPAVIEIKLDIEALTPRQSLSEIRATALAAQHDVKEL